MLDGIKGYLWLFKGVVKSKHKLFCLLGLWLDLEHAGFHPRKEHFNLVLCDELGDGVENSVFTEVGRGEGDSFGGQVQD